MHLNTYQKFVIDSSQTPLDSDFSFAALHYCATALCGEAWEFANEIEKVIRDKDGQVDQAAHQKLVLELGDVLWYVTAVAIQLNTSLEYIAAQNILKLKLREQEGKSIG